MSQTTYRNQSKKYLRGQKLDIGIDHVVSRRAEGADLDVGLGVVQGTAFTDVTAPADVVSQTFKGFALQSHDRENLLVGVDNAVYKQDEPVSVMTLGGCAIPYTGTPTPGQPVYLDVTAGNEGKVTAVSTGNNVAATGWIFIDVDADSAQAAISNIEI